MKDVIAGVVIIQQRGQLLTDEEVVALDNALDAILLDIRSAACSAEGGAELDQLARFQTELARACFKWDIILPRRLRQLVREFDRADDPETRSLVLEKIRSGGFLGDDAENP